MRKKPDLTEPQYLALKKYEDENAHNETALRIHGAVYDRLSRRGYVGRVAFMQSRITEKGRAALKAFEDWKAKP